MKTNKNDKGGQSPTRTKWREWMHSTHKKMSEGAREMYKFFSKPHGEEWRQGNHHSEHSHKNKNKK